MKMIYVHTDQLRHTSVGESNDSSMNHQLIHNFKFYFMFRDLLFYVYPFSEHKYIVMFQIYGFCSETLYL